MRASSSSNPLCKKRPQPRLHLIASGAGMGQPFEKCRAMMKLSPCQHRRQVSHSVRTFRAERTRRCGYAACSPARAPSNSMVERTPTLHAKRSDVAVHRGASLCRQNLIERAACQNQHATRKPLQTHRHLDPNVDCVANRPTSFRQNVAEIGYATTPTNMSYSHTRATAAIVITIAIPFVAFTTKRGIQDDGRIAPNVVPISRPKSMFTTAQISTTLRGLRTRLHTKRPDVHAVAK